MGRAFFRDLTRRVLEQIDRGYDINRQNIMENKSGDRATGLDLLVDNLVEDSLAGLTPRGGILVISEESGLRVFGASTPIYFMVLDPVDGSNNLRPHPTPDPRLGISIGLGRMADLERWGDARAIQVSLHGDLYAGSFYWAVSGQGAFFQRGDRVTRISPSPVTQLKPKALVGMDLDDTPYLPPGYEAILDNRIIQRRLGSTILDLCQVACGQYDAYISLSGRLKVTDVAQSTHLIKTAGGEVSLLPLVDGAGGPGRYRDYLRQVVEQESLLKKIRFRVVAAGTPDLSQLLKWLIRWEEECV
ncbi:MAG: inositol monophosphatase family protein [Bacillota bacterium]